MGILLRILLLRGRHSITMDMKGCTFLSMGCRIVAFPILHYTLSCMLCYRPIKNTPDCNRYSNMGRYRLMSQRVLLSCYRMDSLMGRRRRLSRYILKNSLGLFRMLLIMLLLVKL